jgi:CRP/FNR family cyclic AMP-dependent transcriptional regulator
MPSKSPHDLLETAPMSDSLRALARRGDPRALRKGVQIITEGERGDSLYIVLQGGLRAFSTGPNGREVTYAEYGPGEYVGEMSLDGGLRAANVETTCASVCVLITRATLEAHLAEQPAFAFELMAKVVRRARTATLGMKQIALNSVYGRLKALLDERALPQGDGTRLLDPAPSHLELSQMLGCAREMVSRIMTDLVKGGYVSTGTRRIHLLKRLPDKW